MMKKSKGSFLLVWALSVAGQANAANWLMLQGIEPQDAGHRFFGAVQVTYANNVGCNALSGLAGTNGTPAGNPSAGPGLNNGRYNNNCTNGPRFHTPERFALDTLMLGARGNILPGRVNYFLAANLGENNTTYLPFKTSRERLAALTDASVTFSYIPGARVRAGLFKKPGPEELMQSVEAADYLFPTDFAARVQQERFIHGNAQAGTAVHVEYFEAHRLKLTFIVDGTLVFVLREVMIALYQHAASPGQLGALAAILLVLGLLRAGAVLY